MFLNNAADKLVFKFLNKISHGYLELTTHNGKILKFGNAYVFSNFSKILF